MKRQILALNGMCVCMSMPLGIYAMLCVLLIAVLISDDDPGTIPELIRTQPDDDDWAW